MNLVLKFTCIETGETKFKMAIPFGNIHFANYCTFFVYFGFVEHTHLGLIVFSYVNYCVCYVNIDITLTWANCLAFHRKLHSLHSTTGQSVQDHVKTMNKVFNKLAVIVDAIEENHRVVYLLVSIPESFNVLVTALEANKAVLKMETVIK